VRILLKWFVWKQNPQIWTGIRVVKDRALLLYLVTIVLKLRVQ